MAGGSNGYRAALVRRQLTPELISSLPGTAGLPPFISFLTSYPDWILAKIAETANKLHGSRHFAPHARSRLVLFSQQARPRL